MTPPFDDLVNRKPSSPNNPALTVVIKDHKTVSISLVKTFQLVPDLKLFSKSSNMLVLPMLMKTLAMLAEPISCFHAHG